VKTDLREWSSMDGSQHGKILFLWCPGCDALHSVELEHSPTTWNWNGDLEKPTISPSILTHMSDVNKCHCYVRDGKWEFLSDSYHALAGQTVEMVDLPDWVTG